MLNQGLRHSRDLRANFTQTNESYELRGGSAEETGGPVCQLQLRAPKHFLVIGHSGGDPVSCCENTLSATRAALKQGANAIEIDLSMSEDGIIFLWHDPQPFSWLSLLRRMGFGLSGKCRPVMRIYKPSSTLSYEEIQQNWFHSDRNGSASSIASLDEWLAEFASSYHLELIWLDVKVNEESQLAMFVFQLIQSLNKYSVGADRLQLSVHSTHVGAKLQRHFVDAGRPDLANLVITDTQPIVPYVAKNIIQKYNGVKKAVTYSNKETDLLCGCCANLGLPVVALNKWDSFKSIVAFNVALRDLYRQLTGAHVRIYVYTIDNQESMLWLLQNGVDGIITNHPALLLNTISSVTNYV